ncbi:MAG: galactokinase family protein [Thermomicrobiales bacterium]
MTHVPSPPRSPAQRRALAHGHTAFGNEWAPVRWAIAPGRLELLGNHVDYNGGPVLAGAIDRTVAIGIVPRTDGMVHAIAGDVSPTAWEIDPKTLGDWHADEKSGTPDAYARGIVAALQARGIAIRGADLSIAGDVPLGFGMSSSAALCVALVLALSDTELSPRDTVIVAREAEHRAGAPVGAMDQSASVAGGIILFDGATTTFEQLHPDLGDLAFAVADSGVQHSNATSSYPTRVQESQEALTILRENLDADLPSLGEIDAAQWAQIEEHGEDWLPAPLFQRVRHVVTEVERVREGITAVEASDWATFGRLMTASGRSSATDYAISDPHVEELVAELNALPGVLGARMMGGGEGGPALALIERSQADAIGAALAGGYFASNASRTPSGERFQVCVFGPGARTEE